jgi:O-antigen ligase
VLPAPASADRAVHVIDARWLSGAVIAVAIAATANAGGGYLPTAWGWAIAGPAAVALAALVLQQEARVTRHAAAFVLLFGGFVAWTVASLLWTDSVPRTMGEVERDLVYLATIAALVVLPRSRGAIVAGTLVAICGVCVAALATRLFPDRYGLDVDTAFRLSRPLGYWNGLGVLTAVGALLALGVVVDARRRGARSAAAAALVILLATLFATLSRGAWLALGAGLCIALALHPDRRRLFVAGGVALVPAAVGVALFASANELTSAPSSLAAATAAGHRLAAALATLALAAAAAPWAADAIAPRLPRLPRKLLVGTVAAAALLALTAAAAFAGPAYDAFRTPQRFGEHGVGARLFSLSGQNRSDYWRVALDEYEANAPLGSGAGTYDVYWTRERSIGVGAHDAHSLYVETLAELGPVGLAILVAALAVPLAALAAVRRRPFAAGLAGAYGAFLVHAGLDWDWELVTVTLAAFACAAALTDTGNGTVALGAAARRIAAAAAAALVLAALAVQQASTAAAASEAALRAGWHDEAVAQAARAVRWAPWTARAWRVRSDAERALGDVDAARRSSRRAVQLDPSEWTGWYQLARLTSGAEQSEARTHVRALNPLAPGLDTDARLG